MADHNHLSVSASQTANRSVLMRGNSVATLNQIYQHQNSIPVRNRLLNTAKSLQQPSIDVPDILGTQRASNVSDGTILLPAGGTSAQRYRPSSTSSSNAATFANTSTGAGSGASSSYTAPIDHQAQQQLPAAAEYKALTGQQQQQQGSYFDVQTRSNTSNAHHSAAGTSTNLANAHNAFAGQRLLAANSSPVKIINVARRHKRQTTPTDELSYDSSYGNNLTSTTGVPLPFGTRRQPVRSRGQTNVSPSSRWSSDSSSCSSRATSPIASSPLNQHQHQHQHPHLHHQQRPSPAISRTPSNALEVQPRPRSASPLHGQQTATVAAAAASTAATTTTTTATGLSLAGVGQVSPNSAQSGAISPRRRILPQISAAGSAIVAASGNLQQAASTLADDDNKQLPGQRQLFAQASAPLIPLMNNNSSMSSSGDETLLMTGHHMTDQLMRHQQQQRKFHQQPSLKLHHRKLPQIPTQEAPAQTNQARFQQQQQQTTITAGNSANSLSNVPPIQAPSEPNGSLDCIPIVPATILNPPMAPQLRAHNLGPGCPPARILSAKVGQAANKSLSNSSSSASSTGANSSAHQLVHATTLSARAHNLANAGEQLRVQSFPMPSNAGPFSPTPISSSAATTLTGPSQAKPANASPIFSNNLQQQQQHRAMLISSLHSSSGSTDTPSPRSPIPTQLRCATGLTATPTRPRLSMSSSSSSNSPAATANKSPNSATLISGGADSMADSAIATGTSVSRYFSFDPQATSGQLTSGTSSAIQRQDLDAASLGSTTTNFVCYSPGGTRNVANELTQLHLLSETDPGSQPAVQWTNQQHQDNLLSTSSSSQQHQRQPNSGNSSAGRGRRLSTCGSGLRANFLMNKQHAISEFTPPCSLESSISRGSSDCPQLGPDALTSGSQLAITDTNVASTRPGTPTPQRAAGGYAPLRNSNPSISYGASSSLFSAENNTSSAENRSSSAQNIRWQHSNTINNSTSGLIQLGQGLAGGSSSRVAGDWRQLAVPRKGVNNGGNVSNNNNRLFDSAQLPALAAATGNCPTYSAALLQSRHSNQQLQQHRQPSGLLKFPPRAASATESTSQDPSSSAAGLTSIQLNPTARSMIAVQSSLSNNPNYLLGFAATAASGGVQIGNASTIGDDSSIAGRRLMPSSLGISNALSVDFYHSGAPEEPIIPGNSVPGHSQPAQQQQQQQQVPSSTRFLLEEPTRTILSGQRASLALPVQRDRQASDVSTSSMPAGAFGLTASRQASACSSPNANPPSTHSSTEPVPVPVPNERDCHLKAGGATSGHKTQKFGAWAERLNISSAGRSKLLANEHGRRAHSVSQLGGHHSAPVGKTEARWRVRPSKRHSSSSSSSPSSSSSNSASSSHSSIGQSADCRIRSSSSSGGAGSATWEQNSDSSVSGGNSRPSAKSADRRVRQRRMSAAQRSGRLSSHRSPTNKLIDTIASGNRLSVEHQQPQQRASHANVTNRHESDQLTLNDKLRLAERSADELFRKVELSPSSQQKRHSAGSANQQQHHQVGPLRSWQQQQQQQQHEDVAPGQAEQKSVPKLSKEVLWLPSQQKQHLKRRQKQREQDYLAASSAATSATTTVPQTSALILSGRGSESHEFADDEQGDDLSLFLRLADKQREQERLKQQGRRWCEQTTSTASPNTKSSQNRESTQVNGNDSLSSSWTRRARAKRSLRLRSKTESDNNKQTQATNCHRPLSGSSQEQALAKEQLPMNAGSGVGLSAAKVVRRAITLRSLMKNFNRRASSCEPPETGSYSGGVADTNFKRLTAIGKARERKSASQRGSRETDADQERDQDQMNDDDEDGGEGEEEGSKCRYSHLLSVALADTRARRSAECLLVTPHRRSVRRSCGTEQQAMPTGPLSGARQLMSSARKAIRPGQLSRRSESSVATPTDVNQTTIGPTSKARANSGELLRCASASGGTNSLEQQQRQFDGGATRTGNRLGRMKSVITAVSRRLEPLRGMRRQRQQQQSRADQGSRADSAAGHEDDDDDDDEANRDHNESHTIKSISGTN